MRLYARIVKKEVVVIVEAMKSEARNLVLYLIIAFTFTWLIWIPQVLEAQGVLEPSFFTRLKGGAFGPLVAAFVLTYWNEGPEGVKTLLKRAIDYKFSKVWWLPIFLFIPFILGGALILAILSGEVIPELSWVSAPWMLIVTFVWIFFNGGPVQEEFGWRGYTLDRLQERFNALVSSVINGVIWFAWHLPLFYMPREEIYYRSPMLPVLFSMILVNILFTWIYNNTGGSLLAALITHTMWNWSNWAIPTLQTMAGGMFFVILFPISLIIVLVIWGPRRMVRHARG